MAQTRALPRLLGDFQLLVILFASFRLLLMMTYQPMVMDGVERGLGAQGDRFYHFQLAELTAQGDWPFIDWWSEFPPVWYLITTGIYQLLGENVDYSNWSMTLGLLLLVVDTGNLILIRRIGAAVYDDITGVTLAWIYALLLAPMVFIFWNFENLVAFFLLLGLWQLVRRRDLSSAAAAGLGMLTKFTPALLFGAVIRFRKPQAAARYIAVTLGLFAAAYLGLYALNAANDADPQMVTVSLTAQFSKASYQTVWALLDENYTTGNFGTVQSHYDPAAASILYGNPAVIPSFIRLAAAGLIGLFVFWQTRRFDERGVVCFVTITLLIFFLQSQGWSPQWLAQILPLVILCFPTRNGVLIAVLLSLVVFAEYPLLFIRTGDTGGVITGALLGPFTALIAIRTLILVGLCLALFQILRQTPTMKWS